MTKLAKISAGALRQHQVINNAPFDGFNKIFNTLLSMSDNPSLTTEYSIDLPSSLAWDWLKTISFNAHLHEQVEPLLSHILLSFQHPTLGLIRVQVQQGPENKIRIQLQFQNAQSLAIAKENLPVLARQLQKKLKPTSI